MKKYKLTDETTTCNGKILYRIKALKNFNDVEKNDLGGFIEKESNLSHEGNCWIYDDAMVYDNAKVYNDAWIYDNAWIFGKARVFDNAEVLDNAKIYGKAKIYGNVEIFGKAMIFGNARIFGNSIVFDNARISGEAEVSGDVNVYSRSKIKSKIKSDDDYICLGPFGLHSRYITIQNGYIACGCFYDTIKKFKEAVRYKYGADYGGYSRAIKMIDAVTGERSDEKT